MPPIVAGDVLFVKGHGGIAEIGTSGGLMGHVVLVLAAPKRLARASFESQELLKVFPTLDTSQIWMLQSVESARGHAGLHRATLLLYVEPRAGGHFALVGEVPLGEGEDFCIIEKERVILWQSPPELRARICGSDVAAVLAEMKESEQSWSLATAARALLSTAAVSRDKSLRSSADRAKFLRELQDCWDEAPICTSVVIVFWQRYLCILAAASGQEELDMILRWMPLKADRGLPGDLIGALRKSGWTPRECMSAPQ